jgi:hypothetical protein
MVLLNFDVTCWSLFIAEVTAAYTYFGCCYLLSVSGLRSLLFLVYVVLRTSG